MLRKISVVIQTYTYFEIIYFALAIVSIAIWIIYNKLGSKLDAVLYP